MANFNQLVRVIAEIEGLDEMTVSGIGQYARDAGLITKGGRGRSAATMTARDAANLLIGVNATGKAKDAAEAIAAYRALVLTEDTADYLGRLTAAEDVAVDELWTEIMPRGVMFGDALEALITASMPEGEQPPALVASCNGPDRVAVSIEFTRPVPEVRIFGEDAPGYGQRFEDEELPQPVVHGLFTSNALPQGVGDRRDRTSISSRTLLAVGQALAA